MFNHGKGFELRSVLQARGQGSRLRSAAPYFIKAYLLAAFLTLVGKCAAFLPPLAVPFVLLLYAIVATIGALYYVVIRRIHKQDMFNKGGDLSKLNRKWKVWFFGLFCFALFSALVFVLGAPRWDDLVWVLVWFAIPLYYVVFLAADRYAKQQFRFPYHKAKAMKWSCGIALVVLCLAYALLSVQASVDGQFLALDALRNPYRPFEGSPSALLCEVDKLSALMNNLTNYGLSQIAATSFFAAFIVKFALAVSVFLGVVSQFGFCVLTWDEVKSEFQLLPSRDDDAVVFKEGWGKRRGSVDGGERAYAAGRDDGGNQARAVGRGECCDFDAKGDQVRVAGPVDGGDSARVIGQGDRAVSGNGVGHAGAGLGGRLARRADVRRRDASEDIGRPLGAQPFIAGYFLIAGVVWLALSGGFLWLDVKTSKMRATSEYTAADAFVARHTDEIIAFLEGGFEDYLEDEAIGEEYRHKFDELIAAREETLDPLIDAYYDQCITHVDSYLDWRKGLFGGIAGHLGGFGEGRAVESFKSKVAGQVDATQLESAYAQYVDSLMQLRSEYWIKRNDGGIDTPIGSSILEDMVRKKSELKLWRALDDGGESVRSALLGADGNVDDGTRKAMLVDFIDQARSGTFASLDEFERFCLGELGGSAE